jgi:type I site-specific restriction endonuclease
MGDTKTTANGPADYAIIVTGQPLGIVEAKKLTVELAHSDHHSASRWMGCHCLSPSWHQ